MWGPSLCVSKGADERNQKRTVDPPPPVGLEEAEKWLAQVLHSMAKVHIAKNEPAEAVRLAYEAHALCKRARDKPAEAGTLLFTVEAHLSLIAQLAGGFTQLTTMAEKAGLAAKKIADKLGHKQTIADCFYALSEINLVSGKYQEALDGADEGIKIYQDVGYELGECTFVNMKAQALLVSGKSDEALVAAKQAVSMAKAMDDKPLEQLAGRFTFTCAELMCSMRLLLLEYCCSSQETPVAAAQTRKEKKKDGKKRTMRSKKEKEEQEQKGRKQKDENEQGKRASEVVEEKPKGWASVVTDSLMSIEFRSQVNSAFSGLGLSSTLTFDYPTIRELTGHIVEKSKNQ
ncbi:unnamed protein product [Durusdinium trenchii]|uniref:Carrier domain-containing protein n=1 Tax=Durusdinium trenchii TaxID=1381693 RepID=A0ABP0MTJ2_9DINO